MSCSGLHCAGCAGGMAVPVVPLVAAYGAVWVVDHLVEVIAVSATCGVLAVAAVIVLMRWCNRREIRYAATRTLWTARPDALPQRTRVPAIENHVHYHVHVAGSEIVPATLRELP